MVHLPTLCLVLSSSGAAVLAPASGSLTNASTTLSYTTTTLLGGQQNLVLRSIGEAENKLLKSTTGGELVPRRYDLVARDLWKLSVKNVDTGDPGFGTVLTFSPSDPQVDYTSVGPVEKKGSALQQVEFRWDDVEHASAPGHTFDVWIRIELRAGERQAKLFGGVVNDSATWSTHQYTFPYVEVQTVEDESTQWMTLPIQSGLLVERPLANMPGFFYGEPDPLDLQVGYALDHPGWMTMQWISFYEGADPDPNLFYWSMQDGGEGGVPGAQAKYVGIVTDQVSDTFTLSVTTRPPGNATAGGSYDVAFPVALGVLRGDWYDAAVEYRSWAEDQPWTQYGKMDVNPRSSTAVRDARMLGITTPGVCCNTQVVPQQCGVASPLACVPLSGQGTGQLMTNFATWPEWRQEIEDHVDVFDTQIVNAAYDWDLENFGNLIQGGWLETPPNQPVADFVSGALGLAAAPAVDEYAWGFYFGINGYDTAADGYGQLYIGGPLNGTSAETYGVRSEDGALSFLPSREKYPHVDCGALTAAVCSQTLDMCAGTPWPYEQLEHFVDLLTGYGARGVYLDAYYSRPLYCYDAAHGHPLGGGHWWTEAKVDVLRDIHDHALGTLGLPDFFLAVEWPLEAAIGEVDLAWDGIGVWPNVSFNAPLFTTVYREYTRLATAGVTHSFDSDKVDTWFRARLRYAIKTFAGLAPVGGAVLRSVALSDDLADPTLPHYQAHVALVQDLIDVVDHPAVHDYVAFGERLRDPRTNAPVVTFREGEGPQPAFLTYSWEQPTVFVSAWRLRDGSVGFLLTNWTDDVDDEEVLPGDPDFWGTTVPGPQTIAFQVDPQELGLPDGTHRFTEFTAQGKTPGTLRIEGGRPVRVSVTLPERSSKFFRLLPSAD